MDSESSSKIPHNPNESKEEIINEETMQGPEHIPDVERIHQRMLEMQKELIKLLENKGKEKSQVLPQKTAQWKKLQPFPELSDKKDHNHHFQGS
ncbi:hypothetical protein O181_019324 [Austropuccinia psidii MF-1]|uniref:Uncharacterized protein n=1 Tax=Austropuccinia psidii MF-1 TaxID=1389203 RepID=A0A9Q3C6V5_9BASI|nr:hypothetical protein [Austropuccinia psidii MF-1]